MKRKIILFALVQLSTPLISYDAAGDVPSAHELQRDLRHAHHRKLAVLSRVDPRDHLSKIAACHGALCNLKDYPARAMKDSDCTSAKCKIMRSVNHITFHVQELMKHMCPEDIEELKIINDKIHELRRQLRGLSIEDETFKDHPIGLYF